MVTNTDELLYLDVMTRPCYNFNSALTKQLLKVVRGLMITFSTNNQCNYPDSKVHGANMGPIWVLSAPDDPHVGPVNLAIRVLTHAMM